MMRVGYAGVGLMGHGAAGNILAKGFPLTILGHRNRVPVDDLVARLERVLAAGHGDRYVPRLPGIMAAMAGAPFRDLDAGG